MFAGLNPAGSIFRGKVTKASLYLLDAGYSDVVLIISSFSDESMIRGEGQYLDHGGIGYQVFKNIFLNGDITRVTTLEQVPVQYHDLITYETSELEELELTPIDFLNQCGDDFTIDAIGCYN